jgi:hypothetical protein
MYVRYNVPMPIPSLYGVQHARQQQAVVWDMELVAVMLLQINNRKRGKQSVLGI